jgi:hypothetical protein
MKARYRIAARMAAPFRSQKVADIIGPLNGMVNQLKAHADNEQRIAIKRTERAGRLLAQSEVNRNEASHARTVADKIAGLFS